ncbi:MAG: NAD(P)H-quinone oxidoreductase [Gammaproteobacteria bacterium]|nr:NAD(P)H-quinone oxidoreductase [Gammaproteobacteria bacterium]MDX2459069.1 NAD(P)H-quinone oxidoreductase [Gammaproteobacteria bacterium]
MNEQMPSTMRAIEITEPGGPEVLRIGERPVPEPGEGEVLIKVAAAGVNRPDVMQRTGMYPPPPGASDIPGLEIAGTVAALGADAGGVQEGDLVCALVAGGGYADYCVAPASLCLPVPEVLSAAQAAAIPETFFTVWTNVFDRGRLASGESLLVHGGSSGIGTTAIQLAKAFGATVYVTAGSDEKCNACTELGADAAINYRDEDFVARISELTNERGVDVILDMIGGDYLPRNLKSLAVEGRIVQIALQGGPKVQMNLLPIMLKRLTLTGSTLRPRTVAQKAMIAHSLREKVWPLLESEKVRPIIHATFPLAEASEAHRMMESSQHIGKIVLSDEDV